MKIKASWAVFVPIMVGTLFLHLYYTFFIGGEQITQRLFGEYYLLLNNKTEPEMITLLGVVMFVFALFFSLIDRKTSPLCDIKSNVVGGLFSVLTALLLGVQSAVGLLNTFTADVFATGAFAMNVFGIVVAIVFAVTGMGLLIGFNIAKKIRLLMLLPTLWAVVGMINSFVSHRKEAPSFAFFDVLVWVFFSLFLFYNAMVLCGIEIKNPVKSSFVFGLPAILFTCAYVITSIKESMDAVGYFDFTQLTTQFVFAALALYALFTLTCLSGKMKKKAVSVKNSDEDFFDDEDDEDEDVVPEAAYGVGSTKYVTAEFEKIRLEKAAQKAKERTGSIPVIKNEEEPEEEPVSTLDKIDQLIMELSENDNK